MHVHTKTDSDLMSLDAASSPPRSPRRPLYYVQSPSAHDTEKMSYGSSPATSPHHHFYHCSPIHHSRESSTSRFSASLRNPRNQPFPGGGGGLGAAGGWRKLYRDRDVDEDDEDDGQKGVEGWWSNRGVRVYVLFVVAFFAVFAAFSLILWGVSRRFWPKIAVKALLDTVKWDDKGLAVAIVQNVDTGAILMRGFVNRDALATTISSYKATFYSRSRSKLWTKGETSSNFINVCDVFIDCDRDSISTLVFSWQLSFP